MTLRLNGSTSGYTEIDAPAVAGSNTLVLPSGNGTADQALVTNGSGTLSFADRGRMVLATAQNSTSGTSIDFTGIPSWVKRVTVTIRDVSTNGNSQMLVQLGTGSIVTTGYSSRTTSINGANQTNANANGNGFGMNTTGNAVAAGISAGQIIFTLHGSNVWVASGSTQDNTSALVQFIQAGLIALSGTLDRIRITTANGTDTFDAGSINILYEG
jgi:hypothetical protein